MRDIGTSYDILQMERRIDILQQITIARNHLRTCWLSVEHKSELDSKSFSAVHLAESFLCSFLAALKAQESQAIAIIPHG
jgi:hypothetical protein